MSSSSSPSPIPTDDEDEDAKDERRPSSYETPIPSLASHPEPQ